MTAAAEQVEQPPAAEHAAAVRQAVIAELGTLHDVLVVNREADAAQIVYDRLATLRDQP